MLEGRQFTIFTDHKPITYAFAQDPLKNSPLQARHVEFIGQFTTDIRYVKGEQNVVADTLSRINTVHTAVEYGELEKSQKEDYELRILTFRKYEIKITKSSDTRNKDMDLLRYQN